MKLHVSALHNIYKDAVMIVPEKSGKDIRYVPERFCAIAPVTSSNTFMKLEILFKRAL
jgi:hypothetical protein